MISRPDVISDVCNWLRKKDFKKVLDVGCGFGLWGFMCKMYLKDVIVHGIEIVPTNIDQLQRCIYDHIFFGNANDLEFEDYDLIILGDVLEHFVFEDGKKLLEKCRKHAKIVLIITPIKFMKEPPDHPFYERHLHIWKPEEFPDNPIIKDINHQRVIIYEM